MILQLQSDLFQLISGQEGECFAYAGLSHCNQNKSDHSGFVAVKQTSVKVSEKTVRSLEERTLLSLSPGQWDQDYRVLPRCKPDTVLKKTSVTIETADKWAHARNLPLICVFKWEGSYFDPA